MTIASARIGLCGGRIGDLKRFDQQQKKDSKKVWTFQKRCSKKKCSTKMRVKGQGQYKLSRAGRTSCKVRAGGKKVSCSSPATTPTTQTFSIKVKKGAWIKGKWRVAKWVGTLKK